MTQQLYTIQTIPELTSSLDTIALLKQLYDGDEFVFDWDGLPDTFRQSFQEPPQQVVERYLQFLMDVHQHPNRIHVIGDLSIVAVYTDIMINGRSILTPVNWGEPPNLLEEYSKIASKCCIFSGPSDLQIELANLLAYRLNIPVEYKYAE